MRDNPNGDGSGNGQDEGVEMRPLVAPTDPPSSADAPGVDPNSNAASRRTKTKRFGLLPHPAVDLHPRRNYADAPDAPGDDFADEEQIDDETKLHDGDKPGGGGTATPPQTIINIFISFVGAGMLGMPHAFSESGWALGTVCLCSVSAANVYCMLLLVKTRRRLELLGHKGIVGYGDVGRIVLGMGGERLVNWSLVISQVGFATAYIIFIAANVVSVFESVSRAAVCYGCIPVLSCLVQIQSMAVLSPFSLLADVANLSGTSAVFFQDIKAFAHHETIKAFDYSAFLYVTAVSVYSLEGVGLVLPLESSCVKRDDFPRLLGGTVVGITILISAFGVCGYVAFGSGALAPVTLNLTGEAAAFVKLALCLALYLTYPVMLFPVNEVMEDMVLPSSPSPQTSSSGGVVSASTTGAKRRKWSVPFRAAVVLVTAMVAHGVPDFGKFLGLVGSSICTLLGFIIPCVLHLVVFDGFGLGSILGHGGVGVGDEGGATLKRWELGLDAFLIVFGIVFGLMGTYSSFVALMGPADVDEV